MQWDGYIQLHPCSIVIQKQTTSIRIIQQLLPDKFSGHLGHLQNHHQEGALRGSDLSSDF